LRLLLGKRFSIYHVAMQGAQRDLDPRDATIRLVDGDNLNAAAERFVDYLCDM
jgi:hypothetical protein